LNHLQQSLRDFSLTHFPFLQNYFWHPHVKKDQMHRVKCHHHHHHVSSLFPVTTLNSLSISLVCYTPGESLSLSLALVFSASNSSILDTKSQELAWGAC
jgi:hypothetical protein